MTNINDHKMFKPPRVFLTKDKSHQWFIWMTYAPPSIGLTCWHLPLKGSKNGTWMCISEPDEEILKEVPWQDSLHELIDEQWRKVK